MLLIPFRMPRSFICTLLSCLLKQIPFLSNLKIHFFFLNRTAQIFFSNKILSNVFLSLALLKSLPSAFSELFALPCPLGGQPTPAVCLLRKKHCSHTPVFLLLLRLFWAWHTNDRDHCLIRKKQFSSLIDSSDCEVSIFIHLCYVRHAVMDTEDGRECK